ncbi:stage V sporulation protein S [Candidatus Pacearchaeota archaeon]|jgi:stage V sporulation protein SpoVS|nr:stage V sporulation protein S [Candidatus Pacearchaeota archaeon]|tara:strand:+ start:5382 stop:5705 length:324 start_codon:yes stop_codon:yes gene_type:complete
MSKEDNILKIRGGTDTGDREDSKTYIKKVARAILTVINKYGDARLRTVGAPSVNNAVKAIIIAKNMASDRDDIDLIFTASFDVVDFDGHEKTAIMFTVFPDEYEEEE